MIKLSGKSIALPLRLIFQPILKDGVFLNGGESNVVPCHENDSKTLIKNYRPINLLIFSKVFERLTYNSLFNYFSQLLSINHEFYKSFDYNPSVDVSRS